MTPGLGISGAGLAADFARNTWIVREQCKGLDHADSLLQTPYRINCLNWTLGHLLDNRGAVLELLGEERIVPSVETARYRTESDPILEDGPGVLPLERLLAALEESQERIAAALGGLGGADLAVESDRGDGTAVSLWSRVHSLYFHDTYHTGQTELLRQVTGVGDKII